MSAIGGISELPASAQSDALHIWYPSRWNSPFAQLTNALQVTTSFVGTQVRVPHACTLTAWGVTCTSTTSGASMDMYLYTDTGQYQPGDQLAATTVAATAGFQQSPLAPVLTFTKATTLWFLCRATTTTNWAGVVPLNGLNGPGINGFTAFSGNRAFSTYPPPASMATQTSNPSPSAMPIPLFYIAP